MSNGIYLRKENVESRIDGDPDKVNRINVIALNFVLLKQFAQMWIFKIFHSGSSNKMHIPTLNNEHMVKLTKCFRKWVPSHNSRKWSTTLLDLIALKFLKITYSLCDYYDSMHNNNVNNWSYISGIDHLNISSFHDQLQPSTFNGFLVILYYYRLLNIRVLNVLFDIFGIS